MIIPEDFQPRRRNAHTATKKTTIVQPNSTAKFIHSCLEAVPAIESFKASLK